MKEKITQLREELKRLGIVKTNDEFGRWLGYDRSPAQIASDFCTGQRRVPDRLRLKLFREGWLEEESKPYSVTGRKGVGSITVVIFAPNGKMAIDRFKRLVREEYDMITAEAIERIDELWKK